MYVTMRQLSQIHPGFTISKLRWFWFKRTHGFSECVLQIGRRLFVNLEEFEAWVAGHGLHNKARQ